MDKISWKFILSQVFEVLEMERGLLFNLKELTLRPNRFITRYLSGHTKGVMNPFTYLFLILTIITLVSGVIENHHDGFAGTKLFDINVNWPFLLAFVGMLFLLVFLQCLVFRIRLMAAIISATFFTAQFSFFLSITVLITVALGFEFTLLGRDFLSELTLVSNEFPALLLVFSILTAYLFLFFQPTMRLPKLNFWSIARSVSRSIGILITALIWYTAIDIGINLIQSGHSINTAQFANKWDLSYQKSSRIDSLINDQIDLNSHLLNKDSSNTSLHSSISSVSLRLDSSTI